MTDKSESAPPGWEIVPLAEVAIPSTEKAEPSAFKDSQYIGLEHIEGGTQRILGTGDVSSVKSTKAVFRSGDVLYGKLRPYLNKVCLPDFDGVCSTDILVFPHIRDLDNGYLMHFLSRPSTAEYATQNASGINLPRVSAKTLGEMDFPLAPIAEQRRIVAKIEALWERSRKARELLTEVGPLLEQFRESLLAAAFRGDLTADWRKQNPDIESATELLARIRTERRQRWGEAELATYEAKNKKPPKDWQDKYREPAVTFKSDVASIEFGIPEDSAWEVAPLELLVDPERSIPYGIVKTGDPYPAGVPTVRGGDIKRFTIALERLKQVNPAVHEQYQRTWLRGGEVLIAIRGTVGETAVVSDEMKGMNISREVALIPVLPNVESRFLMYLLASPAAQRLITGQVKGVAQSGINLSDLRLLPTPLPSLEEQTEIANRIEQALLSIDELSRGLEDSHGSLSQLGQSILAKAFRGELVPQDPNDEPASVLLERIREARAHQKEKTKVKGRKKRSTMRQSVSDKLKEWIKTANGKPFTFDDLRRDIPGDYDQLKDAVFALLDDQSEIEQIFDESTGAMSFRRVST